MSSAAKAFILSLIKKKSNILARESVSALLDNSIEIENFTNILNLR